MQIRIVTSLHRYRASSSRDAQGPANASINHRTRLLNARMYPIWRWIDLTRTHIAGRILLPVCESRYVLNGAHRDDPSFQRSVSFFGWELECCVRSKSARYQSSQLVERCGRLADGEQENHLRFFGIRRVQIAVCTPPIDTLQQ